MFDIEFKKTKFQFTFHAMKTFISFQYQRVRKDFLNVFLKYESVVYAKLIKLKYLVNIYLFDLFNFGSYFTINTSKISLIFRKIKELLRFTYACT